MVDAATYIPRFISERPLPYSECAMCAGVMGYEASTLGSITEGKTNAQLEALLDQLRASVGITSGGQTIGQVDRAMTQMYPDVPPMQRPIGDTGGLRLSEDEFVTLISNGWSALVCGNPSQVTNVDSKLRQWQNNDNYNHAIHIAGTQDGKAQVQDPLGGWSYPNGTNRGYQLVPFSEVLQFGWRTPDGKMYAGLWQKGAGVPAPVTVPGPEPTEGTTVQLIQNVDFTRKGILAASSPAYHPTTLAKVTRVDAGPFALLGESEDGKYWAIRIVTSKLPDTPMPVLLFVDKANVTDVTFEPRVPLADFNAVKTQLEQASAQLQVASDNFAFAKEKAGEIVAR